MNRPPDPPRSSEHLLPLSLTGCFVDLADSLGYLQHSIRGPVRSIEYSSRLNEMKMVQKIKKLHNNQGKREQKVITKYELVKMIWERGLLSGVEEKEKL